MRTARELRLALLQLAKQSIEDVRDDIGDGPGSIPLEMILAVLPNAIRSIETAEIKEAS